MSSTPSPASVRTTADFNLRDGDGTISAAEWLVQELRVHGVTRIFCVPGESFLAVLDALVDVPEITVVTCRHESGAAMMAEAYGKMTGRPGVAFVTRGPGATNAAAGVHIAHQDSTPMILFIGDIDRSMTLRDAFQEIDFPAMFKDFSKFGAQISDGRRIGEMVSRAFYTAVAGRPGPVVLSLPEDMLRDRVAPVKTQPAKAAHSAPSAQAMQALRSRLVEADRPILIVGGGGWSIDASRDVVRFAEAWSVPVAASFRCQDFVDNSSAVYAGNLGLGANPALVKAAQDADLIILLGGRLGEISSNGYTLLDIPTPRQNLVHIHGDPEELGRVYQPVVSIVASASAAAHGLAQLPPPDVSRDTGMLQSMRQSYMDWTTPGVTTGKVQMGEIMLHLRETLPADAIITNGAGNFAIWPNRFHRYGAYPAMLAPRSGSMGYGVPAAISAKLEHPGRDVVCFAGDGDFLMTGQELATARMLGVQIVVLILNNAMYGTIRMHQEREYPGRVSATDLVNPDFVQLAQSYGAYGARVAETSEFPAAFAQARASGKSAVIEIVTDRDQLSPTQTVASLRANAKAAG